jgi:predicted nucleic acid-binding protein
LIPACLRQFLDELLTALPVHPATVAVALRAGQVDGENAARGVRISLADLLIGALELGYGVATANLRHFQMVPGLAITQL